MTCFYNDASWLDAGDMRMVHPQIDNRTAEIIGCKSLRIQHQVGLCTDIHLWILHADPGLAAVYQRPCYKPDVSTASICCGKQAMVHLDPWSVRCVCRSAPT